MIVLFQVSIKTYATDHLNVNDGGNVFPWGMRSTKEYIRISSGILMRKGQTAD
ncbi:MAG: hypothetical protein WBP58_09225 [Chitinophagaceae bacterium]